MFQESLRRVQTFSVLIEKEIRKVDKDGIEAIIIISYKCKFVDSGRFMARSLSNVVDNLTEGTRLNTEIVIVFLKAKVPVTI